jgi:RNA polymerase sigma-32 factor
LQDRERSILAARRLSDEPLTLDDLSRQFGISRERVRQIEAKALEKLQRLMTGGRRPAALVPA